MDLHDLSIQNQTPATINVFIRPVDGRLLVVFFPEPTASSHALPPGMELVMSADEDEGYRDCIHDNKLSLSLRNPGDLAIVFEIKRDAETNAPVIIVKDPDGGMFL